MPALHGNQAPGLALGRPCRFHPFWSERTQELLAASYCFPGFQALPPPPGGGDTEPSHQEGRPVAFSLSVLSDSLRPHGLQHNRLPCLSPSPRACSNSCPLSQCCLPTISSSVTPFSCCLPSFPASGSFLMSWLFASGGQSIGTSASASVLPMKIQG